MTLAGSVRHLRTRAVGTRCPDTLMRASGVEIPQAILLRHVLEVPLAKDDDVIDALAPDATEKPLANGISAPNLS